MSTTLKVAATLEDLQKAYAGSYYFIAGTGGSLDDWIDGYEGLLAKEGIGKPVEWLYTTGAAVNLLAGAGVQPPDLFPLDLSCLLFPLTGLNPGKLAILKLGMADRWFDDVIDNMRTGTFEEEVEES